MSVASRDQNEFHSFNVKHVEHLHKPDKPEISNGYQQDFKASNYPLPGIVASYMSGWGKAQSPAPHSGISDEHSGTLAACPALSAHFQFLVHLEATYWYLETIVYNWANILRSHTKALIQVSHRNHPLRNTVLEAFIFHLLICFRDAKHLHLNINCLLQQKTGLGSYGGLSLA